MAKKLEGNGMWESSRMMLPEHREAIIKQNAEVHKKSIPTIHPDEWETYNRIISESFHTKLQIKITVFGDYEDIDYTGVILKIDQICGEIKLDNVRMLFTQIVSVIAVRALSEFYFEKSMMKELL
jgi:hypothetical protein